MRIAYYGRFGPGWATERDLAAALRRAGHDVLEAPAGTVEADLAIWTPFRLDEPAPATSAPMVGYHLDRYWGLRREAALLGSAWARCCELLVTADGGHDERWARAGIRHRWLPPAIDAAEAALESARDAGPDVVFVGSWRRYHPEWGHRPELVRRLSAWYGDRFEAHPRPGAFLRGQELTDVVRRARVVVGDSCLAGGASRYWSDRVPETLGRGGFLVHPEVDGMEALFGYGEQLVTWPAGDWTALKDRIDSWLDWPEGRAEVAAAGRAEVRARHTYDNRAAELVAICAEEGLCASS